MRLLKLMLNWFCFMLLIHFIEGFTSAFIKSPKFSSRKYTGYDISPATRIYKRDVSSPKKRAEFLSIPNGEDLNVSLIVARWNSDIVDRLVQGVVESLTACGVNRSNIKTTFVPGSFELPIAAKLMANTHEFDVVVCLGCLIKGETDHFEHIAQATSIGIMQVGLKTCIPCVFGVLTVLNKEQAEHRSRGKDNEGLSWGRTAVEMAQLRRLTAVRAMDTSWKKNEVIIPKCGEDDGSW